MSTEILEKLKVTKYNIVLYLGAFCLFLSMRYRVEFLEEKNLFGLSLGLIISGLAVLFGHRVDQVPIPGLIVSQEYSSLGKTGLVILLTGIILVLIFLGKIGFQILA
jgi:hypothetical protein